MTWQIVNGKRNCSGKARIAIGEERGIAIGEERHSHWQRARRKRGIAIGEKRGEERAVKARQTGNGAGYAEESVTKRSRASRAFAEELQSLVEAKCLLRRA